MTQRLVVCMIWAAIFWYAYRRGQSTWRPKP